ncbi:MAG: hypothetical protein Q9220_007531 [cf. Caloplaca sp. 1 TL-2023]
MSSSRRAPLTTGHDPGETPELFEYIVRQFRHVLHHHIPNLVEFAKGENGQARRPGGHAWKLRSLLNVPTVLTLSWLLIIWWGELGTFQSDIRRCDWHQWERWPKDAVPHRVVLVADPQLVDPHTYPGRPWPLSTITRHHTDYYMRKSFTLVQTHLEPKTVFFLGDLFDGGREWLPPGTNTSDLRWRKYGEDYWLQEYKRFGNIFFNEWGQRAIRGYHLDHQKILAGLPGNHDLGLGNGIKLPVRKRFNAFFGDGNHVDIIGNHTFVSLDTVSLSAKGQLDPTTGQQGAGEGEGSNHAIWGPTEDFLEDVKTLKRHAIDRIVRLRNSGIENDRLLHKVLKISDPQPSKIPPGVETPKVQMPSILLTHVPLYRPKDTPCGALREHFPPSTKPSENGEYIESDTRNAIRVAYGVQYQNVLTPEISNEIIDKVGDVEFAFSGDDHDYCDIVHRGYTSPRGGIREITVKSFSWAMGVRRPGFLLLSLSNPLDHTKHQPSETQHPHGTIQTHLCLLPNQLSIFIRYLFFLGTTFIILFIHAIRATSNQKRRIPHTNGALIPLATTMKPKSGSSSPPPSYPPSTNNSSAGSTSPTRTSLQPHPSNGLAVRSTASRTRNTPSPMNGYSYPGPNNINALHDDPLDERWSQSHHERQDVPFRREDDEWQKKKHGGFRWRMGKVEREMRRGVLIVGLPVGAWWIWLASRY